MRKRNALNYATVRAVFDAEADNASDTYFKVGGPNGTAVIPFPTSVMFRMFRIGQAYGIRQLRYLESDVKIIIGSTEMASFLRDLRRLLELVNDEVQHHHVGQLVTAIHAHGDSSTVHAAVATGSYFEAR